MPMPGAWCYMLSHNAERLCMRLAAQGGRQCWLACSCQPTHPHKTAAHEWVHTGMCDRRSVPDRAMLSLSSAFRVFSTFSTPAWPSTAKPCRIGRPTSTASAPSASACVGSRCCSPWGESRVLQAQGRQATAASENLLLPRQKCPKAGTCYVGQAATLHMERHAMKSVGPAR